MARESILVKSDKDWLLSEGFDWREGEGISPWLVDEETKSIKLSKFYTATGYFQKIVECKPDGKISFALEKAIEDSKKLLELKDDWDGEGSLGYSETTLNRAVKFLRENAINYFNNSGVWLSAPEICPGPDGSIDLLWKLKDRELLINIPVEENQSATYYGDDSNNNTTTKGKLNLTERHEWILMWLMK